MSEDTNKNSKDYMNKNEFPKKLSITNNNEKIKYEITKNNKTKKNCLFIILVLITSSIIFIYLFFTKIYNIKKKKIKIIAIIKIIHL